MGALVRLLSRVRAVVDCQCALLDEALAAVFHRTLIWPLVGVNAVVPLKVRLPVEALHHDILAWGRVWVFQQVLVKQGDYLIAS